MAGMKWCPRKIHWVIKMSEVSESASREATLRDYINITRFEK
jgi:hypothetical protein